MSAASSARSRFLRRPRLLRSVVLIALALLLLPYIIAPFYLWGQPHSTLMLWRAVRGERVQRAWVPLDQMAPALPLAVIAAEDARFCSHRGIDWDALQAAIEDAEDGGPARGASTISQQTAKNLFLWGGRSYIRKALELPLALWIDLIWPKQRLLEIYLNIAEWGPNGVFGAEAASRRAFGKSARDLSPREAAILAAALPNPIVRNAARPGPGLRRLAARYEERARGSPQVVRCIR